MFARRAILLSGIGPAVLAVAFSALAAACSPASAAVPMVMLAYDRWVIRSKGWAWRLWRLYFPITAVVAIAAAWRVHAALAIAPVPSRSALENLLTESIVMWRYVALLAVPVGQAIVHDVRWITSPADPLALLALLAIAAAVAGAVSLRRRAPLASVGAIWFLAALAPTSSFVPLRDPMAEPRLYVAGAGLIFAVSSVLAPLLASRRAARVAATAALAVLGFAASTRTRIWQDPLILWTEAVQRAPGSWQAHFELAAALEEIGACDRAAPEYAAATRLNSALADRPREAWRSSCSQGRVER
jgi:protein O-mannosyl-transferase